jgi:phosphatidylserine synthase
MSDKFHFPNKVTAILVYGRPPLVFAGMLCAIAVMWAPNPNLYMLGVVLLFISMSFDLVDGWFAARFHTQSTMAQLADRLMDKVVYAIIFPLVAVGIWWKLLYTDGEPTKVQVLHGIMVLLLAITVLLRDNFAAFMRGFAMRKNQEPELSEFTRLRTGFAAPVGAVLYAYAFYVPEGPGYPLYSWLSIIGNIPLKWLLVIEIVFFIINIGSIAGYCRRYGTYCLDELCLGNELLRRRILSFFPNALTVMNALMGLMAIFFAYQGRIREAYLLLIGGAFFDKLDGAVARRLGLTEPLSTEEKPHRITFGGLMDDIADAISFCIAPACIFYISFQLFWDPSFPTLPVGLVAVAYAILGIVRLIYFTLDQNPIPGFFKGMPTPAAALLVVAPMIIFGQAAQEAASTVRFWGTLCFITMIVTAVLMNLYPVRYLHIGRFMSRHPWIGRMTFLILLSVFTPYFGHICFFYMLMYVFSPLVTWRIDPKVAAQEDRAVSNK